MSITLGTIVSDSNPGWTLVSPLADSSFTTWTAQQGSTYTGNGSRFLFVAASTSAVSPIGSDSTGTGTALMPYATINKAVTTQNFRAGSPDWILIRNGDTFASPAAGINTNTPVPADSTNLATYDPIVITGYDPAASFEPPIPNPGTGPGNVVQPTIKVVSGVGGIITSPGLNPNICFMGLKFYGSDRDPTSTDFTTGTLSSQAVCINSSGAINFVLVEGCTFLWGTSAIQQVSSAAAPIHTRYWRNSVCQYENALGPNGGIGSTSGTWLVESSLFDTCGWFSPLAITITISGSTLAWTGTKPDGWNNSSADNGAQIKLFAAPGSTLPNPINTGQRYFVTNAGASNFQIKLGSGGSPLTLSGGTGSTFYALCDTFNTLGFGAGGSHSYYLDGLLILGIPAGSATAAGARPCTLNQVIQGNECSGGGQFRSGGIATNGLIIAGNNAIAIGAPIPGNTTNITQYVCTEGGAAPETLNGADYNFDNYSQGSINISNNIVYKTDVSSVHAFFSGPGFNNVSISNNIIYSWTGAAFTNGGPNGCLALSLNAAGSGGTGMMQNFDTYNVSVGDGVSGTPSVGVITPGTGGTAGTRTVTFTSTGTGANATGTVTVSSTGGVTAVSLTNGGTGQYTAGDLLTASFTGSPTGWHFAIQPYIIALKPASGSGSGAKAYVVVCSDKTIHTANFANAFIGPRYWADGTAAYSGQVGPNVAITANGSQYSSGQTVSCSSTDPNFANIPTGFSLVVGPYQQDFSGGGTGISMTGGSGTGLSAWIQFAYDSGLGSAKATGAIPFYNGYGTNFNTNDTNVAPSAAVQGITGATFKVTALNSNVSFDTSNSTTATPSYPIDLGTNYYGPVAGSPGGFQATSDGLLNAMAQQTRGNWNSQLTANAVNTWVRAAFGIGVAGPPIIASPGPSIHKPHKPGWRWN